MTEIITSVNLKLKLNLKVCELDRLTNNWNTKIDNVVTNCNIETVIYECFFSDHKCMILVDEKVLGKSTVDNETVSIIKNDQFSVTRLKGKEKCGKKEQSFRTEKKENSKQQDEDLFKSPLKKKEKIKQLDTPKKNSN